MPWDSMSCKYQKRIKHQEERIRYLELELRAARDEINSLENRNTNNLVKDNDNTNDIWLKTRNPKSRARKFSANDMSHIRLSNKFSVLEADQQNQGSLTHDMKIKSLTRKSNSQKEKILLLGSSHGRNTGPLLQNHLGTEYEVMSIFKPNVPLENIVEDLENFGKDLTKKTILL